MAGWLLGVIALGLVAGCGSTATASRPQATAGRIPVAYAMVINTVQRPYAGSGPLMKAPAAGQEYLALDVTLLNTGANPLTYNPLDFRVKDRTGHEYTAELAGNVAPRLQFGTLAYGELVSGELVFLLPAAADGLTLRYAPAMGTAGPWITEPIAP